MFYMNLFEKLNRTAYIPDFDLIRCTYQCFTQVGQGGGEL